MIDENIFFMSFHVALTALSLLFECDSHHHRVVGLLFHTRSNSAQAKKIKKCRRIEEGISQMGFPH